MYALCAVARVHQIAADSATVAHQLGFHASERIGRDELLRAAQHLGLKANASATTAERLPLTPLPALAQVTQADNTTSYVILAQCDGQRVLIQDPGAEIVRPAIESMEAFTARWTGELILITSRASLVGELAKFDFSWFVPALVKYRKLLGEVLLISLMLQLFALVSPLFFPGGDGQGVGPQGPHHAGRAGDRPCRGRHLRKRAHRPAQLRVQPHHEPHRRWRWKVDSASAGNLTAEIKTGERRVIEYLLSPIQKAGNEALRER
nr:cysteine peptidase family C39 domain-containing protein [Caenimonas aquaedulcis]